MDRSEPIVRATARELLDEVRELVAQGEFLAAYDASTNALERQPSGDEPGGETVRLALGHLRALSLARAGSTDTAAAEVGRLIREAARVRLDPDLAEDIAALDARITKDRALRRSGADRRTSLASAAERYEAVFERFRRPYAGINAATLWAMAGEAARSTDLARAVSSVPQIRTDEQSEYWYEATAAEASILLGDLDGARSHLEAAALLVPGDRGVRTSTVRQLDELCRTLGVDDRVIEPIRNPPILHYCGHRIDEHADQARLPPDSVDSIERRVKAELDGRSFAAAHGSLSSGADLVLAEAIIERGIDLHVVMPFDPDEFVDVSVAPAGDGWIVRFWRCLDRATSVLVASDSGYLGDDVLYGYAASIAMGTAINRARTWATDAAQIAVWDGRSTDAPAGTAHDVARWRSAGGETTVIDVPTGGSAPPQSRPTLGRRILPVLFGDARGFSRLHDDQMISFSDEVLGRISASIGRTGGEVLAKATWGDGLKLIMSDVGSAADLALDIQAGLAGLDLEAVGLPIDMGLRMSGHVGPVLEIVDPITGQREFIGRELTRAARIEPTAPVGQVYVTNAFAALLALIPESDVTPEYVGTITTAKDFETIPMYVLNTDRHRQPERDEPPDR